MNPIMRAFKSDPEVRAVLARQRDWTEFMLVPTKHDGIGGHIEISQNIPRQFLLFYKIWKTGSTFHPETLRDEIEELSDLSDEDLDEFNDQLLGFLGLYNPGLVSRSLPTGDDKLNMSAALAAIEHDTDRLLVTIDQIAPRFETIFSSGYFSALRAASAAVESALPHEDLHNTSLQLAARLVNVDRDVAMAIHWLFNGRIAYPMDAAEVRYVGSERLVYKMGLDDTAPTWPVLAAAQAIQSVGTWSHGRREKIVAAMAALIVALARLHAAHGVPDRGHPATLEAATKVLVDHVQQR